MKSKFEAFQFKVLSLIFEHFIYVKWLEKTYFRKVCAHKNLGKRFSKENFVRFTPFVIHIECKELLIRINDDMVCNLCKCMSQLGFEKEFLFLVFLFASLLLCFATFKAKLGKVHKMLPLKKHCSKSR